MFNIRHKCARANDIQAQASCVRLGTSPARNVITCAGLQAVEVERVCRALRRAKKLRRELPGHAISAAGAGKKFVTPTNKL